MTQSAALRFAPSPNGDLHLGHALSALIGAEMARRLGGRFLVRIEDIDGPRSRETFVQRILDDLVWLGIEFEVPVLRQQERFAAYRDAVQRLEAMGLLYPCFASRKEISEAAAALGLGMDPDGSALYPSFLRDRASSESSSRRLSGEPHALRLDMEKAMEAARRRLDGRPLTYTEILPDGTTEVREAHPEQWGDAVIVRKETPSSYTLSVVVDDAFQGVTHVTRGADIEPSTGLQRLIQVLLGLSEPVYHHHRLIRDGSGRKLSKSAGDTSLRSLRDAGATPEEIRRAAAFSASDVPNVRPRSEHLEFA